MVIFIDKKDRTNPEDIVRYVLKQFGTFCGKGSNLFSVYITLKEDCVTEVNIEQYNGNACDYPILPDTELVKNDRIVFGETYLTLANLPTTTEHTWIKVYAPASNLDKMLVMLIEHAIEAHKDRIMTNINLLLDDVKTHMLMLAKLK